MGACWIALWDVRHRRIPNGQVGLLLLLTWLAALMGGNWPEALQSFTLATVIGLGLYLVRFWAGGDAKLYMALAPLMTPDELLRASFWILLIGGVLAAGYLIKYRIFDRSKEDPGLPYGLAILLGVGFQLLISTSNT
ncbi:A24 family peptidase [Ferrimonas futtsuensis]|uniref:A24 family peptidase n=1 Tax=Ferrimonas futtsuensis TaxID=364764 RepID=UPI00146AB997|nr:prepilin peptidase [Ferrimonas futtsuensis]